MIADLDLFGDARAAAVDALHTATAIYTTEPVVDELLEQVDWPNGDSRLLDPSCGDGVFLGRALHRLLTVEPGVSPSRLGRLLEGWEVHPHAAHQARSRLATQLIGHGWNATAANVTAAQLVRHADFLTEGPHHGRRYDVIAGNPPYLRAVNVPELLRQEYEAVTPDYARADLLHTFLDRCARLVADEGVVAMVTADRWLFNANASRLREAIGERVGLVHLARLDAATAFYRPKQRRAGTPPRIHPVAIVLGPRQLSTQPITADAIHPDAAPSSTTGPTLADVAVIRQGPWLGRNGIFVVDAETARPLPPECLVPAVGPKDIVDGKLGEIRRWAIRTSADTVPPDEIMAHLDANLHRMAPRGRRNPRWLPPETWGDLPYDRTALLIPRIAKTVRPVELPPGVLPTNHDVCIVSSGWMSLSEIQRLLCSPEATEWMRARAPRLENGYLSITPTLLKQLPIAV